MFRMTTRRGLVARVCECKFARRVALVVAALVLCLPSQGYTQGYAPPDPDLPLPLYNQRPEDGGFFLAGSFVMYRWNNALDGQSVAVRGFVDVDGTVTRDLQNEQNPGSGVITPNTFYGSRTEALSTSQLKGPVRFQPGFTLEGGWKFGQDAALTLRWMYLSQQERSAIATLIPPGFNVGPQLQDTFLTSFVYNFPQQYAGPANPTALGDPFAVYGIWNGATEMSIDFTSRVQEYDITYRETIAQNEWYRFSGTVGARFFWIWERFKWRTVSVDATTGASDPSFVGIYTNIVSNRMYGINAGFGQECYLGHGFAAMLDVEGSFYVDIAKERVKYELGAKFTPPQRKRSLTEYTFVPAVRATAGLMWYPIEGVQVKVAYDAMAFFNTITSPRPIDFDWGRVRPDFVRSKIRLFDGLQVGIAFLF